MKQLTTIALSAQLALLLQTSASPVSAQMTRGRHPVLILQEGDNMPGADDSLVTYLSGPVEAGGDSVGIAVTLGHSGEGALVIAHHDGRPASTILPQEVGALQFFPNRFGLLAEPLWGSNDGTPAPFAVKATMLDGDRALLTSWGVAQRFGDPAPGLPKETVVTDTRRIQMLANGQAYWTAHWASPWDWGKALYRLQPGPRGSLDLLMSTGDPVCGGVLEDLHHFRIARDQTHAQVVDLDTGSGNRTALYVGGKCPYVAGEALPSSQESPTDFWHFDVNSSGHLLFGAITDGPDNRNAVYVLDGQVVMREGSVVDGVHLAPPDAAPNQVRLDDRGRAVTLWTGPATAIYTIFYTPDIGNFADTRKLVSENTPLDFDDDGLADALLREFRFFPESGPTFSLADTGIYIAAWLRYPGFNEDVAAVIFYPF